MQSSTLEIFVIAIAVLAALQAATLLALAVTVFQARSRMQKLMEELHQRALPVLESADSLMTASRGKIDVALDNIVNITTAARGQMERLDATVNDVVDRTRLQVIRADEMMSRTMDKVEETTELVQHSVVSPVRQLAGLIQGLSVGLEAFFGKRKRVPGHEGRASQDEELFI